MEKLRRGLRTLYFMMAMLASLVVQSAVVLVAVADVVVPFILVHSFVCVTCYSLREHLKRYAFKSSLIDIPLVSLLRSLIITCVYLMCDGAALSEGPYLGTVTLCSISSILLLTVKACVFSFNSQLEVEASSSIARRKLHIKKSWGMPVLFLSSVVFALGHTVVAYRTSCRARRKLLFHRVDSESVLSCKAVFSNFEKIPRSPTPAGRTPRSGNGVKRKLGLLTRDEREFPARLLADVDSLFMLCQGLVLHYKLSTPGSHSRSLSSTTFLEKPSVKVVLKSQCCLQRSLSNQFHGSSLHTPLLESSPTSPVPPEDMPTLRLDETGNDDGGRMLESPTLGDLEASDQFGIVLVHGFGGGIFSWRKVMDVLSRLLGCSVAAFDRPGWGLTSRPSRKDWEDNQLPNPYKIDTQVDLLLSFCRDMRFTSVVIVGHDDGGLLALKAAERVRSSEYQKNVDIKGIVLLGVSMSRVVVPGFARILLRTSLGKKHLVRPLLRTEITQVVNRRAWYNASKLTTEVLSLYKAPLCVEGWDEALHEIGKLSFETVLPPHSADSLLKAVEQLPVLVVAGVEDALVPLKSTQIMASKLQNSRLVTIHACGHLPHEECPKEFLEAISPFISKIVLNQDMQHQ